MGPAKPYYIMTSEYSGRMLLASLPAIGRGAGQEWIEGRPFATPPTEPVRVKIREEYEDATILDWFDATPVMTPRFYEALRAAGVDNLQAFDAFLESEDGSTRHEGFKAVNVLGIVSMASARTRFSPDSPGRLIHTFIDQMNPDTTRAHGLDLFRLAESLGHVVVSGRVKAQLDGRFPHLVFRPLEKLVT